VKKPQFTPLPPDIDRPVDPRTGAPIVQRQPGYYPGYSTLSQQAFWDAKTRALVLDRVKHVPPIRFFSAAEALLMETVCEHIVPQSDRDSERRIPIINFIDQRLFENRQDGYRYENMPSDQEAHRLGLRAIDESARRLHGVGFTELKPLERDRLLKSLHDQEPVVDHEIWKRLPVHRYWMLLVRDCVDVYYAHPWAWDEIGYGGPAYPRAYMRLERGEAEPWEVDEHRYEWQAPPSSVSDEHGEAEEMVQHDATPGQGGTH
jgi:hypothetical protein